MADDLEALNASREMINQDMKVVQHHQYLKTYLFADLREESPEKAFLFLRLPCKLSVGSFLSSLVSSYLFITVDNFLALISVEDDKVQVLERLELFKKEIKVKDLVMVLTYVKKGLIFDSTKEIRVHFDRPEDIEGFKAAFLKVLALPQK